MICEMPSFGRMKRALAFLLSRSLPLSLDRPFLPSVSHSSYTSLHAFLLSTSQPHRTFDNTLPATDMHSDIVTTFSLDRKVKNDSSVDVKSTHSSQANTSLTLDLSLTFSPQSVDASNEKRLNQVTQEHDTVHITQCC